MMSRPWILVCLLLLIVFSSQFEWKQQYEDEFEAGPNASQKEPHMSEREESVKEKVKQSDVVTLIKRVQIDNISNDMQNIILSQEKNIQRLNELVQNLRKELNQCRGEHAVVNGTMNPMTELLAVLEKQPILND